MSVFAVQTALARACVGVHKRTSIMSSFLLLQLCSVYLIRLTWMVCEMGGKCSHSSLFCGFSLPGFVR